ncbi:DEAD/DEAH box helicase family protein [Thiomicrorhabdus lithotrophica]|uniref:DEAD/DEAH box helicase family protein n=1 Tax=Thiomicrorhabdus lithotrophica TaxID=2949997 RepID=A0ABY8C7D2_9GAMM|nr:DEAD/DEAH box helicase family protein [Thiomicrorhabdus lithotrophica]WEJ61870.1 DEAD/DEAH box helicase family protein [Thiomicrorhabdus lithotrophica]
MINDFKQIDSLSPSDFEFFVKEVFEDAGWSDAVITQVGKEYSHGDGGVDIFAYKNRRKFAIEVKQRNIRNAVDTKALNQLVTGARLASVQNMILVTNSYFTSEVKVRALKLGVELFDRDGLQNLWIEKHSEVGRNIKMRQYQQTINDEAYAKIKEQKTKLLIEMATGLGKTYTVANLVKTLIKDESSYIKKVLFLAHQVEILLQSVTAFKNILGIGTYSFSACFNGASPENTDFVFGSFDTFYSKINELKEDEFDLVIVDEAHHVPARTYSQVVDFLQPQILIGLTATPFREDLKSVTEFFGGNDGHIGKYDLAWALKHNKLAFPKYKVMLDDLNNGQLEMLKNGMSVSDVDKSLFLHKKDEEIVRLIEKEVSQENLQIPKGIVFCKSIEHMQYMIKFFKPGAATLVHSKMPDSQRRENIRSFREGDHSYILVCDLFNEGIDIPETNLLVFIRYTGSKTVWLQQLGRGLRKTKSKEFVVVLDFVGSLERLNEVHSLAESIRSTPIDKNNYEERYKPEKQERGKKSVIHNDYIEVTYNEAAADVLELIKNLNYRLNFRAEALNLIRHFYETEGHFPDFYKIEEVLKGLTRDQINTLFGSYLSFLIIAFNLSTFDSKLAFIHEKLHNILRKFEESGFTPSHKAISQESIFQHLPLFTEKEVNSILKRNTAHKERHIAEITEHTEIASKKIHEAAVLKNPIQQKETDIEKIVLLEKYKHLEKVSDLRNVPDTDMKNIKRLFKSKLLFLKVIENAK